MRNLLVYDYDYLALNPKTLWTSPKLRQAITIHPVKNPDNMQAVHHFYKTLDMQVLRHQVRLAQSMAVQTCQQLPEDLRYKNPTCKPPPASCESLPSPVCTQIPRTLLPRPYHPRTLDEIPVWAHFDYRYIHQLDVNNPRLLLGGEFAEDVESVTRQAIHVLTAQGFDLHFEKIVNGFVHYDGLRRREYILDIQFSSFNSTRMLTKRISIIQPLTTNYVTTVTELSGDSQVYLVTPLYNVKGRFDEFMRKYEKTVLENQENLESVHLWLVVFGHEDVRIVRESLNTYQQKYPTARMSVTEGKGPFARGVAIDQGVKALNSSDLIFICDVDLDIHPDFFKRCARNTVQGQRVYYPMFFKLYNQKYMYGNTSPSVIEMVRQQGHWASYSYGMLCIYQSDYIASGGFDTDIVGWGGEDVDLYEKVIKAGFEVLRVPDPGLIHRWHPKVCHSDLDETQYSDCMYSKAENYADRQELSRYIKELEKEARSKDPHFVPPLSDDSPAMHQ